MDFTMENEYLTVTVTTQGANKDEVTVRIKSVGQDDVQAVQADFEQRLKATYPNLSQAGDVNYVGPLDGATLLKNAFWSVVIASALMLVYIAFRFDFNSGVAAVCGLLHDVLMMLAFMVILRNVVQMNSSFIAAMLTIVGYSINNTIIIYDRLRENRGRYGSKLTDRELVNLSINQTLSRSIITTCTTVTSMISVAVVCTLMGVTSIISFAIPLAVGMLVGFYSSVCLAGPIWIWWQERKQNKKSNASA